MRSHRMIGVPLVIMLGAVGLAMACFGHSAGARDKKASEKQLPEEIEKLINDLGNSSFMKRAEATKLLREMPGALLPLRMRAARTGLDLEERRRIDALIAVLCQARFKRRLESLAKEKSNAPLDLLTDLLLENREHVTEHEWALVIDIVSATADKLSQTKKKTKLLGYELFGLKDHRTLTTVIGKDLSLVELGGRRIIADRLSLEGRERPFIAATIAVLSERVASDVSVLDGVLLISGNGLNRRAWDHVLRNTSHGFIFCDGDYYGGSISNSIVIASASVNVNSSAADDSIVLENARQSAKVRYFSLSDIGLKLVPDSKMIRVTNVASGSKADLSGFKVGDIFIVDSKRNDPLVELERHVRRAYAGFAEITLTIRRQGREQRIKMSFAD